MWYNSQKPIDVQNAKEKMQKYIQEGKVFELNEDREQRSIDQNSYLHLILSWYGLEYGETMKYIKEEVFKKQVNRDLFILEIVNPKTNEIREGWKSTKDLNTEQMTMAIERFRDYSAKEAGFYIPDAVEKKFIEQMKIEVKNNKKYL